MDRKQRNGGALPRRLRWPRWDRTALAVTVLAPALVSLACTGAIAGSARDPGRSPAPTTSETTAPASTANTVAPAHGPTGGDTSGAPSPGPANRLRERDFPDPFLLRTRDGVYVYATNADGKNIQIGYLANGQLVVADALPRVAMWSDPGSVWAPAAALIGDQYVIYYTTRERSSGRQCISVATSATPTGPFVDDATEPLVCDTRRGGSIDPSPVQDDSGQRYLLWTSGGNSRAVIYSQPLDTTGLHVAGDPVELVRADKPWEGSVVEAPSMIRVGDAWYLFYSGNNWASAAYAIGYAVCASPRGPCTKLTDEPLLRSDSSHSGPGSAEAITDRRGPALIFAAWTPGRVSYDNGGKRGVHVQRITITGPTVALAP